MMELHDRLDRLAGPAVDVSEAQAAADLARGRRALRHRRTVKGAATGVFAVAAATAALAYGTASQPAAHPAAAPGSAVTWPAVVSAALVAYHGEQPKGYTIDKVPSGWEIQGVDPSVLTIAPTNAKDKDPHTFVGKIAIMLQSEGEQITPSGTAVTVDGKSGFLITPEGQAEGRTLYVKQPNGVYLIVQIGDARGWSNAAIVEFAAGIHVLPGAQLGKG
ncbi:hypothetical protein ACIA5C_04890 [Actinoplanes sp. NPDC051343]|uniref:hypothetical protein n=1 Tax=Actinoplanes sp. NPDC051343 TaxID=3363906 RepID=UPI0037A56D25